MCGDRWACFALLRRQIPLNPRLQQVDKNLVLPKASSRHNPLNNSASVKVAAQKILPLLIEPRCPVSYLLFTSVGGLVGKYGRFGRTGPGILGGLNFALF
jgi:hypothetical protein